MVGELAKLLRRFFSSMLQDFSWDGGNGHRPATARILCLYHKCASAVTVQYSQLQPEHNLKGLPFERWK